MKNGNNKAGAGQKCASKDAPIPIGGRSPTLREAARKRGRKRVGESRASEIRTRLVEWKLIPEPVRISLRALAVEIGTSHQLLSFYLRGLNRWQAWEYRRKANDIRARAEGEGRAMTNAEQAQALACDKRGVYLIDEALDDILSQTVSSCLIEVKRGTKLPPSMLSVMRTLARKGDRKAQEVVRVHENLPRSARRVAKSFRWA
jgi:hypothetical protein